ncbi:putative serpin-Z12 [Triticum dicoccoides]|uniref:putative serpin-Z12 n=1 Tax=Triticum dicoccoides TaxID=85692 RepID=UPI001890B76D|nr:putative serpin-Z12 [Triticum dicoccoides]
MDASRMLSEPCRDGANPRRSAAIPMSRFGKAVLLCLTLFAAWHLCSALFTAAPPGPGADHAEGSHASCLPLAREVGVRAAAGTGSNFVFSPLSIHAALAMVAAGARGDTRRELLRFLGSSSLDELHHAPANELVGRLNGLTQTSFACGVWVDRRHALRPEFAATDASRYAATAESVDFVSGAEQARQRVNGFVADATKQLIRDILPPGSVDSSTAVVLANALYFKGAWSHPFDVFTAPFHVPGGTTVGVPSMTTGRSQYIALYPGFRALKLPYKNNVLRQADAFYMLILLPDSGTLSLADLYNKAVSTPEFIRKHTPVEEVPVGRFMVPRFNFTFEFEASSDMQKLGVTRAFSGGDFSGMVSGEDGLSISRVYHKATIEVDEQGTVAAAATVVVLMEGSALEEREPPHLVDFVADRPFLFAVVEEKTGAVLFLGHVVNPLAG